MMTLGMAGLKIRVDNNFSYIEELSEDYLAQDEAFDFSVDITEGDLHNEAKLVDFWCSEGYLESTAVYRKIAEKLPEYGALVFHGAVIAHEGKAYAVTARSGVGKTTHLRLWLKQFGDKVYILNGDKPILRVIDGKVYASGTPWRGKEGYGRNEMLPLAGIAFITRAVSNSSRRLASRDASIKFLSQTYIPKSAKGASEALAVANGIITKVPFYEFCVNMEQEAAIMAKNTFTAKEHEERI